VDEGKGRVGLLRSERVPDNNFSHGGDCLPAGVDGMKKKRKYISPYRQGIKDCDMLWAFIIKARAGWRCELAGKDSVRCTDVMQAAHLYTRGVPKIRHDLRNGRCTCSGHHSYYTFNEHEWQTMCGKYWGRDYTDLNLYRQTVSKPDLGLIFQVLKIEARQYEPPENASKRLKELLA